MIHQGKQTDSVFTDSVPADGEMKVRLKDDCLKCHGDVHASENEIDAQIARVAASGVPLSGREQYEKRLSTCHACDRLAFGTTCMTCGCFVKVRAMNALRICPHESGSKW